MKKIVLLVCSLVAAITVSMAQDCALKSNILSLGIGSLSLGAEFSVAHRCTVDLSGMVTIFSPWRNVDGKGDGLYLNGWSGVVEGRYYLCKAFNGHHFGAYGQLARYGRGGNILSIVDGIHENAQVVALGVSYGYYFKLNSDWGIDTNVGIGAGLGRSNGNDKFNQWILPTARAQVSVSYKF